MNDYTVMIKMSKLRKIFINLKICLFFLISEVKFCTLQGIMKTLSNFKKLLAAMQSSV